MVDRPDRDQDYDEYLRRRGDSPPSDFKS